MSNEVIAPAEPDAVLAGRRTALLVPALIATMIGGFLLGLWLALSVATVLVVHQHPDWMNPNGAVIVEPSTSERIGDWARFLVPVILGVIALALTWLFRARTHRVATWACAALTVLLGLACWL